MGDYIFMEGTALLAHVQPTECKHQNGMTGKAVDVVVNSEPRELSAR